MKLGAHVVPLVVLLETVEIEFCINALFTLELDNGVASGVATAFVCDCGAAMEMGAAFGALFKSVKFSAGGATQVCVVARCC